MMGKKPNSVGTLPRLTSAVKLRSSSAPESKALASIPEQNEEPSQIEVDHDDGRSSLPNLPQLGKADGYEIQRWLDSLKDIDPTKLVEYEQELLEEAEQQIDNNPSEVCLELYIHVCRQRVPVAFVVAMVT